MAFSYMNIYFFCLFPCFPRENRKGKFRFHLSKITSFEFVRFEDILEGGPFVCILVSFSRLVQDVSVAIDRTRTSLILQVV